MVIVLGGLLRALCFSHLELTWIQPVVGSGVSNSLKIVEFEAWRGSSGLLKLKHRVYFSPKVGH